MPSVFPGSFALRSYTQSQVLALSASTNTGYVVYVSDTGTLAYSDGSAWNFYGKPSAGSAQQSVGGLNANSAQFSSREAFIAALTASPGLGSTIANTYENVEFERYYDNGPEVKLTYRVVTSNPTTDPTAIVLVAGTHWLTQRFEREVWLEQFGARGDGTTSDTTALINAITASTARNLLIRAGDASYLIDGNDTANADVARLDAANWFDGAAFIGNGKRRTRFIFQPRDPYQGLFRFNGGSGDVNNKRLESFTIQMRSFTRSSETTNGSATVTVSTTGLLVGMHVSGTGIPSGATITSIGAGTITLSASATASGTVSLTYNFRGTGVGIRMLDSCFVHVRDIAVTGPALGLEIANVNSGGFCEFNTFENLYFSENTFAAVHMHRRGGLDSLHGNKFINCFAHVQYGGPALKIGGSNYAASPVSSSSLYLYNAVLQFSVMSNTASARDALVVDNLNTDGNEGWFRIESTNGGSFNFTLNSGIFTLYGGIYGISAPNFTGANRSKFNFMAAVISKGGRSPKGAFTDSAFSSLSLMPFANLGDHGRANGSPGTLFGMSGFNVESVGISVLDPALSGNNGVYIGYSQVADGDGPLNFRPGFFLRGNGTLLEGSTGQMIIRQRGQTNGITIENGRFGGSFGRSVPTALQASNGIPAGSVSGTNFFTLWTNAWNESASDCFVIIRGNNVDYRYRLCFSHDGFGGSGYVSILATLRSLNSTGGAVTAPAFSVDSSGNLRVTITTDRDLTVRGSEMSWNGVRVS